MTHLRQIMLEKLERRNYAQSTIRTYIRTVEHYSHHFRRSPEQLGLEHIRQYQAAMFRTWKLAPNTVARRRGLRSCRISRPKRQRHSRGCPTNAGSPAPPRKGERLRAGCSPLAAIRVPWRRRSQRYGRERKIVRQVGRLGIVWLLRRSRSLDYWVAR